MSELAASFRTQHQREHAVSEVSLPEVALNIPLERGGDDQPDQRVSGRAE
jgi:hypothetical protein